MEVRDSTPTAAEHVRRNLPVLRRDAGYSSQVKLSDRMAQLGTPMHHTVIAKIESGDRAVSVDDLVALAAAVEVSPLRLLLPDTRSDDAAGLRLGGKSRHTISAGTAWRWAEQVEPWWSDESAEDVDPHGQRYALWSYQARDDGTLASLRYADPTSRSAELIADASGGVAALVAEVHDLRKGDYAKVLRELRDIRRLLRRDELKSKLAAREHQA